MTTIAWDGTTLAGDTLGIIGGSLKVYSVKVFALEGGRVYGGAGAYQDVLAVRDWLAKQTAEKPSVQDFAGLVIDDLGKCWRLEEALIYLPITEPFHACGSGRDFALAAMAMGQDAATAVRFAAQFDVWTNDDVITLACSLRPGLHHFEENGGNRILGRRVSSHERAPMQVDERA